MPKVRIEIDVIKEIEIHLVRISKTQAWAHTHGMSKFGLPELEIRDFPMLLGHPAASVLNHVCHHMLNSKEVIKLGTPVRLESVIEFTLLKPETMVGYEDHYLVERWQLVDLPGKSSSHIPSWEPKT